MPWQSGTEILYFIKLLSIFNEIYSLKDIFFPNKPKQNQTKNPDKRDSVFYY